MFIPHMIHGAKKWNTHRMGEGRKMPEVTVTKEYIGGLPTMCALSGVELVFCLGHVNMASLDRIDNTKGYVDGNVRLVDIRFNTCAKWTPDKYQDALGSGWKHFVKNHGKSMPSPDTQISGRTLSENYVIW
jgi:hypothetical protein